MGKSLRLAIVLAGAGVFCFGMLALLLTLPCDSSVGAVTFAFSGFEENSLHLVSNSSWIFDTTNGCYKFGPTKFDLLSTASGRFLHPGAVQMIDPGSTTVNSFSTTFIYQLQIVSTSGHARPGMAFITVPDNVTIGANLDFMGLITNETSASPKNNESDLGVELDTFMNSEFNDPNDNHIGINLASMKITYSFKPVYILAFSSTTLYQQVWIDFFKAHSRIAIYYANYKQDKPAKQQGSQIGLDLLLLKDNMYIGFSTAKGIENSNVPYICAWNFSNDGIPAPLIVIAQAGAQDATPSTPPPPAPVAPRAPSKDGPVAAPSLPPPASIPSPPPLPTRFLHLVFQIHLHRVPASNRPPLRAPNPSPVNPPNAPPPSSVPYQGLSSEPPTITKKGGKRKDLGIPVVVTVAVLLFVGLVGLFMIILRSWLRILSHPLPSPPPVPIRNPPPSSSLIAPSQGPGYEPPPINVPAAVGGSLAVLIVVICLFSLCWFKVWRRPLRIFISHTGGPNGAGKNFPSWLHQAMTSGRHWSRSKFHVKPFLDVENCPKGLSFAGEILKELARFDVGVVVVTPDFFERHWPMTELIKFVEVQRNDPERRIRVLPLFYELRPDELKQGLDQGKWEHFWVEPSEDNHPLELQKCRDAVSWLCKQTGIRYVSHDRDHDKVYIDTILKEVDKILCDERSIAADLRWAMKKFNILLNPVLRRLK